ncbi:manganese/zinc/iron transport system permease protein [Pseudorhodobacter antarcticus]|uniref:Manganese/zinc/iron transport system permease protein n=1 Tax=Pseudorhodobacter antarcticus TaxID=1077947 RepID=A0A1H8GJ37_9RHOB|nr:metal ABC transporter permease [Pseudorhodobacter antarcticus]SEN44201.1 manganese/zinc/iron transport system permease protein [Pseudorhodobacter antarcticus]
MNAAILDALTLRMGYNATLVTLGAGALGLATGAVGSFLFLRRRSLVPDAMAHATLPGVGIAFLIMVALGGDGRFLPGLLLGAGVSSLLGLWVLQGLVRGTRLPEDAAIGIVLSTFYGAGIVLLTFIQGLGAGRQAGLEGFLLGSTAGMLQADVYLIGAGGLLVLAALFVMRRLLVMVAFDPGFALGIGLRPALIDAVLMGLVLAVVLLGIRVVGAILVVALLITPAVAARMWTDRAGLMALIAAAIGGAAGFGGAAISAAVPGVPTGALIVALAFGAFLVSAVIAPRRGLLGRVWAR